MYGHLNPCGGGDPIPLLKQKLLIGRRSRCDIALQFPNVSSHHCELEFTNGYWLVRDLASTNGIKVNGERCDTKWLMPGDVVHVAKHLFKIDYEPLDDAPPPPMSEPEDIMAKGLLEKAGLVNGDARPSRRISSSDDVMSAMTETPPVRATNPKPSAEEDLAFDLLNGDGGEPGSENSGP